MLSLKTYITQPRLLAIALLKRCDRLLSDATYLRILYYLKMGRSLPLKNPVTFNEKLQWLKLNDRNPRYTAMVDKYAVKRYIAEVIGESYVIPTIGVWDRVEDIDFDTLPHQFVLKTTHGGGGTGVVICRDKSTFDREVALAKLRKAMVYDIYRVWKEWPYKNVTPRIIAEPYVGDEQGKLVDYKFYCFDGKADSVMACLDRESELKYYFFNRDWKLLRINEWGVKAPRDFALPKPAMLDEMFALADKLSVSFPHVRVDMYWVDNRIYFGEFTLFSCSGFDTDILPETDERWGAMLDLSQVKDAR